MNTKGVGSAVAAFALYAWVGVCAPVEQDVALHLELVDEGAGSLYVGEPLALEVTTVNSSSSAVKGYLVAVPYSPFASFYARKVGDDHWVRLDDPYDPEGLGEWVFLNRQSTTLRSNSAMKSRARFLVDPRSGRFWMSDATDYEIVVVVHPDPADRSAELRSNVLRIRIDEVPDRLRDAFDAYVAGSLPALVAWPAYHLKSDPRSALRAEEFLSRYSDTPYGRHVSAAALQGLKARVFGNAATPVEKRVYERIETDPYVRRLIGAPEVP